MTLNHVGALVLSAAALSAGMLTIAPIASADPDTRDSSKTEAKHSVDCDELLAHYDRRVKHSVETSRQVAECEKRKHRKR